MKNDFQALSSVEPQDSSRLQDELKGLIDAPDEVYRWTRVYDNGDYANDLA
jgi:hypothetical protein